ncbi:Partitioning defective 3 [Schistosoma japonicum]|nr:Partitioning defective 3 [Schistosoma japonicum]
MDIINDYDNKVHNNKLDGINCRYCDQIHDYQYHEDVTMHHSASPNVLYSRGSPLPQSMMDRFNCGISVTLFSINVRNF